MKAGRKKAVLTPKEAEIMRMLWSKGPMFVREMLEHYDDPKPHVNTVSTTVRILESKGYVAHESVGGSHRYAAVARMEDFRERSLTDLVRDYFNNSYKSAVSALVEEEKISVDELREIIGLIESKNNAANN
ncbi:MAG: BlaI/MecI/CopY family transcriptional regulator [Candidatus Amulumruptor caecigallinarius]|nr:BlaI/MecI/CopY family transcriptional regulator [Candidatus Amulumruptor caecigallinarius]MCM1397122.1 BlaI/MecI/CopY family transcriptional regulator [Candidatus Amulumruptor caecigallinarius]MCM1453932.1 BlaI/MecI/CopY family transcriptional regulator [bacterium]